MTHIFGDNIQQSFGKKKKAEFKKVHRKNVHFNKQKQDQKCLIFSAMCIKFTIFCPKVNQIKLKKENERKLNG